MSGARPGLISVIMPCFNSEAFVEASVRSALTQEGVDVELIAIDDGSTDGTLEILERLAREHAGRMTVACLPHRGPFPARNEGLRKASGDLVAFLDADDYWAVDALRRLKQAIEAADAELAYCGWQNVGPAAPSTTPYVPPDYLASDPVAAFLQSCPWPIHAALTRRAAITAVGGFSERAFSAMDYDLWLRLLAHTRRFVRVPEVLAFYRWHGKGQISAIKGRQVIDAWEAKRAFVAAHPELVSHLGRRRIRELVNGSLHVAALQAHWRGDPATAQQLFRKIVRARDVRLREARHALASLLPAPIFRSLQRDPGGEAAPQAPASIHAERSAAAPVVSVVMPCYNGARFLRTSLGSLVAQSFTDFEVVFVDDGSTDGSAEVASALADARIRVVRQSNSGVSAARNRGLASARGEYIAFLDADDTWHPAFLARMVEALAARKDAALAYCGWQNVGLAGGRGAPFVPPDYETTDKCAELIETCPWPIHAALTRREAIERAGGFDERFAVGEDFLLWMEIACFSPIVRVPEVLAYYHHHEGAQATKDRLRAALEPYRAQRTFLGRHAELRATIGRKRVRQLTLGRLLSRGYASYWAGDLEAARTVFRTVMSSGYGRPRDWRYMLPALLPGSMHAALLTRLRRPQSADERH